MSNDEKIIIAEPKTLVSPWGNQVRPKVIKYKSGDHEYEEAQYIDPMNGHLFQKVILSKRKLSA